MSWEDQGRQEHGWFGHGTAPPKVKDDAGEARADQFVLTPEALDARIRSAIEDARRANAAAARAYAWAKAYGPALFDLPRSGSVLETFAEAVARIERGRPGTLDQELAGEAEERGAVTLASDDAEQGVPGYYNPFGVFIPGTPENEAWTRDTERAMGAAKRAIEGVFHSQGKGGGAKSDKSSGADKPNTSQRIGPDAASLPPNGPNGPDEDWLKDQQYRDARYHGRSAQAGSRGVKSPAPKDGMAALRNSYRASENSPRRIGVDIANKEFVVLSRTHDGLWHGYVQHWDDLPQTMQNVLIRNGVTDARGKLILK